MVMSIEEHNERKAKSYKIMLWIAMVSMTMMFAGLTSAYVVSASRADWLKDFVLPSSFTISTIIMIASSLTFHFAKKAIQNNNRSLTTILLFTTLILGILFVNFQLNGFEQMIAMGLNPTGPTSTVTTSFIYVVVLAHFAHLFGGIISLLIVIYNHFKQKYNSTQTTGIELSAMFWHFLDFLWLYLFLFLYFFK